jgi:hypothetical protein
MPIRDVITTSVVTGSREVTIGRGCHVPRVGLA